LKKFLDFGFVVVWSTKFAGGQRLCLKNRLVVNGEGVKIKAAGAEVDTAWVPGLAKLGVEIVEETWDSSSDAATPSKFESNEGVSTK
jgi:hypothetical protein